MAVQTAWQTASEVRKRLDDALRRAGFHLEPSLVSVTRNGPDRIAPPNLSLTDAERLAAKLDATPESGSRR